MQKLVLELAWTVFECAPHGRFCLPYKHKCILYIYKKGPRVAIGGTLLITVGELTHPGRSHSSNFGPPAERRPFCGAKTFLWAGARRLTLAC